MKLNFTPNDDNVDLSDGTGKINNPNDATTSQEYWDVPNEIEVDENGVVIQQSQSSSSSSKDPNDSTDLHDHHYTEDELNDIVEKIESGEKKLDDDDIPNEVQTILRERLSDEFKQNLKLLGDDDDDDDDDRINTDEGSNLYMNLALALKEKGVLKYLGDLDEDELKEIKTESDFDDILEKEAISRMESKTKELYEKMNGGVDVAKMRQIDTAIQQIDNVQIDNVLADEGITKAIIVGAYQEKGIDATTADSLYEVHKQKGELKSVVTKSLLSKREQLVLDRENVVKSVEDKKRAESDARNDKIKELRTKIQSGTAFGKKVSKRIKEKMLDIATKPAGTAKDGTPLNAIMKYQQENPVDFEFNMMYLYAVTNGFKDLNTFDRKAETKASKAMRNVFESMNLVTGDAITNSKNNKSANKYTIDPDTIDDLV